MGTCSRVAPFAPLLLLLTAGCSSLLGDFTAGGSSGESDTGTIGPDARGSSGGASSGGLSDASDGSTASDGATAEDAPLESAIPIPNRPGLDITAGGNTSTSTSYLLIGAVGEGPGTANMIVGTSMNYTLKGGVIAGTQ
ncbi:MAG: hypothetical protein ACLP1X_26930 [Polyangiaceae bacterium]